MQDVQEQAEFVSNGAAEVDYVSLAERARERRRQLETRHTTVLEPPGYEGLLAVEYRVITYGDVRKITQRHERIQDDATRELYSAADHLIMASINSWQIEPDGSRHKLGLRWGRELAQELGIELSDTLTARQAVFACFPRDIFVANHFAEYMSWLSEVESDIDVEQAADFPTTS